MESHTMVGTLHLVTDPVTLVSSINRMQKSNETDNPPNTVFYDNKINRMAYGISDQKSVRLLWLPIILKLNQFTSSLVENDLPLNYQLLTVIAINIDEYNKMFHIFDWHTNKDSSFACA